MTRDELQAHLEANEERVGRMTDRVENKLDRIDDRFDHLDDRLDDLRSHLGERIKANRNWIIAAVLVLVSMIGYGYSQLQTLSDRMFENAQRIEQVAPQSQPETSGAKSSLDSIQQSGQ